MTNPRSTARVAGYPIPVLVAFPIAFFVATLVCDIIFWQTGDGYWATAAKWCLGAGLVMAALVALAGIIDVLSEPRIRARGEVWRNADAGKGRQTVYPHHVGVSDEHEDVAAYREPRRTA